MEKTLADYEKIVQETYADRPPSKSGWILDGDIDKYKAIARRYRVTFSTVRVPDTEPVNKVTLEGDNTAIKDFWNYVLHPHPEFTKTELP